MTEQGRLRQAEGVGEAVWRPHAISSEGQAPCALWLTVPSRSTTSPPAKRYLKRAPPSRSGGSAPSRGAKHCSRARALALGEAPCALRFRGPGRKLATSLDQPMTAFGGACQKTFKHGLKQR